MDSRGGRLLITKSWGVNMGDVFMTYMLYLDDDGEDDPEQSEISGCGYLPPILICFAVLAVIYVLCH